jgi:hypothetical protein
LEKKKIYTVIDYNDGIDAQSLVLDFEKHLEKKQPIIYQKMIAARTTSWINKLSIGPPF